MIPWNVHKHSYGSNRNYHHENLENSTVLIGLIESRPYIGTNSYTYQRIYSVQNRSCLKPYVIQSYVMITTQLCTIRSQCNLGYNPLHLPPLAEGCISVSSCTWIMLNFKLALLGCQSLCFVYLLKDTFSPHSISHCLGSPGSKYTLPL